jgi:hypothetical protein
VVQYYSDTADRSVANVVSPVAVTVTEIEAVVAHASVDVNV